MSSECQTGTSYPRLLPRGGKNFVGTVCGKGNPGYETSVKLTFDGVKTNFEYGIALKAGSGHLMVSEGTTALIAARQPATNKAYLLICRPRWTANHSYRRA